MLEERKMGYNVIENGDPELIELEKKKKELLVKKVHPNRIFEPTKSCLYYRTRIPSSGDKQIYKKNYNDLIDELYELYYGTTAKIPTLREAVEGWISSREEKKTIEYLTAVHYRADFKKHISDLPIADLLVTNITERQLLDAFETIAGDGSKMYKKTLRNVKTVVNGALDYANMLDGVNCIDARRVRLTDLGRKCKNPESEQETYTREEAEKIITYLNTLRPDVYNLAVRLKFCSSARIGEFLALTWEDYDENTGIINLRHSLVTKKNGQVNRQVTDVDYMKAHSDKGKRTWQLSDYAIYILEELRKINGDKKYIMQSGGKMPISENNFNEHLRAYCEACGIKYKSSHKIRFYACSMMYEAGYDEKTIQAEMGHSSLAMTRHYDRRNRKEVSRELTNSTFGFQIPSNDGGNNAVNI